VSYDHVGHLKKADHDAKIKNRITLFDPWRNWDAMRLRQAARKNKAGLRGVRGDDQGDDPCHQSAKSSGGR
jgi:hypothetical protein